MTLVQHVVSFEAAGVGSDLAICQSNKDVHIRRDIHMSNGDFLCLSCACVLKTRPLL